MAAPRWHSLVTEHVGFAAWMALRFHRRAHMVDLDHLKSAASLGLVKAARRYRAKSGVPFLAYATRRILGELQDACRELDPLSRDERKKHAGWQLESWDALSRRRQRHYDPVDATSNPEAVVAAREALEMAELELGPRTWDALVAHVFDGFSQEELGRELGISGSRVNQLFAEGRAKAAQAVH